MVLFTQVIKILKQICPGFLEQLNLSDIAVEQDEKIIILIPVYNDWESLKKLLVEINSNIKEIKNVIIEYLIINDASTIEQPKLKAKKLKL